MLVSPAEPPAVRRALAASDIQHTFSSVTEKWGSDFIINSATWGPVGVQRKEVNDLLASVHDGRLLRELMQSRDLGLWVLLVEGRMQWTNDGSLIARSSWTMSQHLGMLWSLRSQGCWTDSVDDLTGTITWLSKFEKWLRKTTHSSLTTRPKMVTRSEFGTAGSKDWSRFLLQSFDGIGPKQADAIIDQFGGVPLSWTCTEEELLGVKGIGKVRAQKLLGLLTGGPNRGK